MFSSFSARTMSRLFALILLCFIFVWIISWCVCVCARSYLANESKISISMFFFICCSIEQHVSDIVDRSLLNDSFDSTIGKSLTRFRRLKSTIDRTREMTHIFLCNKFDARAKAKRRWTHEMPMNVNLFAANEGQHQIESRDRERNGARGNESRKGQY